MNKTEENNPECLRSIKSKEINVFCFFVLLIHRNLGATSCTPKIVYRSQKQRVLPPDGRNYSYYGQHVIDKTTHLISFEACL